MLRPSVEFELTCLQASYASFSSVSPLQVHPRLPFLFLTFWKYVASHAIRTTFSGFQRQRLAQSSTVGQESYSRHQELRSVVEPILKVFFPGSTSFLLYKYLFPIALNMLYPMKYFSFHHLLSLHQEQSLQGSTPVSRQG